MEKEIERAWIDIDMKNNMEYVIKEKDNEKYLTIFTGLNHISVPNMEKIQKYFSGKLHTFYLDLERREYTKDSGEILIYKFVKERYHILFDGKNIGHIDTFNNKYVALKEWLDNIPKAVNTMLRRAMEEDKNSVVIKTNYEYGNEGYYISDKKTTCTIKEDDVKIGGE